MERVPFSEQAFIDYCQRLEIPSDEAKLVVAPDLAFKARRLTVVQEDAPRPEKNVLTFPHTAVARSLELDHYLDRGDWYVVRIPRRAIA